MPPSGKMSLEKDLFDWQGAFVLRMLLRGLKCQKTVKME